MSGLWKTSPKAVEVQWCHPIDFPLGLDFYFPLTQFILRQIESKTVRTEQDTFIFLWIQFQKVFSIPEQFIFQQFIPRQLILQQFILQQFIPRQYILQPFILRQSILRWFILRQFILELYKAGKLSSAVSLELLVLDWHWLAGGSFYGLTLSIHWKT